MSSPAAGKPRGKRGGTTLRLSINERPRRGELPWRPLGTALPDLEAFTKLLKGYGDLGARDVVLAGGEPLEHPELDAFVGALCEGGAASVSLATTGLLLAVPGRAQGLRDLGLTGVEIDLPSVHARVLEAFYGTDRAFEALTTGIRRALAAGLEIDVVAPLLGQEAPDPLRLVRLLERLAQPGLGVRSLRFEIPASLERFPVSLGARELPQRSLSELRGELLAAAEAARSAGIELSLLDRSGIPFCLFAAQEDMLPVFRFDPRRPLKADPAFVKAPGCDACHYKASCRGLTRAYAAAFGLDELQAIPGALPGLEGDRAGSERRSWSEGERGHARESRLKIMRLTLACNQRCVFCPTDGSSETIQTDQKERLRQLRRWADGGVTWVSFSGGEPTLVPELPSLVKVAADLGIRDRELITNAVRLADPARMDALIEAGVNRLFISLHSHIAEVSDGITGRPGDFEATLAGIDNAIARGLRPTLNHVIAAPNYRDLPGFVRFISERTKNRVSVTFAFITPLYLAAQRTELIPRISDAQPYVIEAVDLSDALGLDLVVLSRPGIPPCFLGRRRLHKSDLPKHVHRIQSEDAHKKEKSPACVACMYDEVCAGLWKGYTALYGTGEIVPVTLSGPEPARGERK